MTAAKVTRSSRSREELREQIERWIATKLPADAAPEVGEVTSPSATGMTNETLIFDVRWQERGVAQQGSFVGRMAPAGVDKPTFPTYDLELQAQVIALVEQHSDVPVPHVRWFEPNPEPLGAPFFVMDRVEGRVPADNPPYVVTGWLQEANEVEQRQLMEHTVRLLARLHAIDPEPLDVDFLQFDEPGESAMRRHFNHQRAYYKWMCEDGKPGLRVPLIEETFDWLERTWPEDHGPDVISWGDARLANILYANDGFEPVAALDWEMAGIAPRGVDLGWMAFMHRFFEDLIAPSGRPTLPHLMRSDELRAIYRDASGVEIEAMPWYEVYAGLRHATIMSRVVARAVHFGEAEWPENPDDMIPHAAFLRRSISPENA
ncbi:MAG: phosphotransferase family protein [Myxococcota bacterium]